MGLVVLGLLGIVLKAAGIGAVANWSWWVVLLPLALAPLWWHLSDLTGRTRRLQETRHDERRRERRRATIDALGRRAPPR